jgi:serine/threonine protein kinase
MSCRPGPSSAATVTGEPSKNCDERGPLEVLSEADAMFSNDNFAWQMLQNRPSRNILTLNPEIGSSSPLDPLLDLKTLFEILLKSKIPGPKLFRLKSEYSTLLGRGRTFEVFGVSTGYSNLLDYSEGVVSRSGIGQNHERIRESLRGSAIYAIKRARGPTDSDLPGASYGFGFQIRSARREIETLCREPFRNHPNIVRLLGWGLCLDTLEEKVDENPRIPLLILERADCSLTDFLKRGFPSYQDSLNICLDAGNGLSIIHKEGIVHGDMKPDNILMFRFNGRWITKLCDFGLATSEEERDQDTFEYRGTPGWRPPESSQRLASRSLQLCDVFAYGLVVQSVFKCDWRAPLLDPEVDTPPVHNVKEEHIYRRFASEIRKMPHIPNLEINRVLLVLRGCLHTEPSLRKRKPWKYLNQDKYPVIDEAAEIDLAEPIVRVSSPASERSGEWLERPFYVSWLLAACCYFGTLIVQWYRSVVQSLQLFLAELIQLLIQGSLEVKSWLLKTREKSIQQRKYEEIFHSLSSELGLCGNLNDITTFEHPPDQCFKLPSHLYISASHTTYDSNNADDMHLGELSVSVYGWARMRSRFRLCCWQRSMAAFYPSFRTSDIVDFSTLAWILRGDIGSYELACLSPCARWGFLRSCSPRDCTDRMILLMESGCNIGERIGCGCHVGERLKLYTAFRMYLQRCRDGDFDPPLAVMLCRYFKHIAEDQKQTDQVRFFLTGKGLPDRLNEGNDDEDDDGFSTTALHESVLESQYPVVEYLVRSGFVVNATNKDGKTAFQLAYERSQMVREIEKSDILQNERILALLGQHQANSLDIDDLNSGLPLGWEQLQLGPPHSETLFHEKHFGSITFKTPTFSLLDSRRLALGFRRVENSGQTYLLDIVRFIDRGIAGNELLPSIMVSKFSNQWYRDDISRIEYCQTRATGTQESGRNGVSAVKWIHRMQVAMTVTVPRALISLGEELTGFGQRGHMSHLNWVSPNNTDFMFIFVLLCVVSHYSSWPYPTTFVLSVLALIPLVTALHSCIRSISSRLGCSDADSLAAILEYVLELVVSAWRGGPPPTQNSNVVGRLASLRILKEKFTSFRR